MDLEIASNWKFRCKVTPYVLSGFRLTPDGLLIFFYEIFLNFLKI